MSTQRRIVRWVALPLLAALAGIATVLRPTALRLDGTVLTLSFLGGWLTAIAAAIAWGVTVVVHHADWQDYLPHLTAAGAALVTAAMLRHPRDPGRLPSRHAARLLVIVAAAAALGILERAVTGDLTHGGSGALATAVFGLLAGVLIAVAIVWRPRGAGTDSSVFAATLAAVATVAVLLFTLGFWERQDQALLQTAADAVSVGFVATIAEDQNVITAKADTSATEDFGTEAFPDRLQTVVFGHSSMPVALLVQVGDDGAVRTLSSVSTLGDQFVGELSQWSAGQRPTLETVAANGTLTFVGLSQFPSPDGDIRPYAIFGTPLVPQASVETTGPLFLLVGIAVETVVQAAVAPTIISNDEAHLTVFAGSGSGDALVPVYSTEERPDANSASATDSTEDFAQSITFLGATELVFVTQRGEDLGTPSGARRLVLSLEALAGLLAVGLVLLNGNHRMRREDERVRREALLSAALHGSAGWTGIIDEHDVVVMANAEIHGAAAGSPVTTGSLWRGDAGATDEVVGLLRRARHGESASVQHIWTDPTDASHAMRIFEIEARPLPYPGLVYLQCVDVTERRDRAMRTAQSERMEAIGVLAGGLAHDFNNLLFITLGYLQMLERQPLVEGDPTAQMYVTRAIEAVERGAGVAKSLLSFARSQPLTAVPVNLRQFLDDLRPLIEQALGSKHELVLHAEGTDLDVVVDPGRLSSSLLNTVFNARDAIEGLGTVEIRAEHCVAAPLGGSAASVIALSVRDTGRGMPPEVVGRAFEPFFTTKQLGSGTGLGLSTLYSFAQQSGGWAAIESAEGSGTTVTLFLPPALDTQSGTLPSRVPRSATRALVVDDEPALADLVAGWLQDLGMETRVANSPEQALSTAETFRPELLISDANLGTEIDGLELARRLVQRDPGLLVVFMTGFSERIRALQAAGVATLAKPFSRDDLIASLRPHLGDRLAGDQR
ncbi:MAG: response regulator [Ilumatobacteraceae bacterium]